MPTAQRLPFPYRPEADVVARQLQSLNGALDWAAAAASRRALGAGRAPAPAAVLGDGDACSGIPDRQRRGPGPDAAGRGAAAGARCRDRDRAHRRPAGTRRFRQASADGALARLSQSAIAMSKKLLPDGAARGRPARPGSAPAPWWPRRCARCSCWGASSCWARTSTKPCARPTRAPSAKQPSLSFSYDMLGEGARTDADALRYLASYQHGIEAIAAAPQAQGAGRGQRRHLDQAQRAAPAL